MIQSDKDLWVFISHSNKDFEKVRKIRNYLEEHSCRPLLFYLMCLSEEEEIDQLIKREIDCRTRFIICSSEHSRKSKWVKSEIDYIKTSRRSFHTIDLSASEQEIKKELDLFLKSTQVFFSFAREDSELALEVFQHVQKYDIRCAANIHNAAEATDAQQPFTDSSFEQKIAFLKGAGFLVFFASRHSLNNERMREELSKAVTEGARILALAVDENAAQHGADFFRECYDLNYTPPRYPSAFPDRQALIIRDISKGDPIEAAIEAIVNQTFPCWDTYTLGQNFLEGRVVTKDEAEAQRLFRIAFERADDLAAIGYPGGILYVAKCQAKGYGTPQNIHAALRSYDEYILTRGSTPGLDAEVSRL